LLYPVWRVFPKIRLVYIISENGGNGGGPSEQAIWLWEDGMKIIKGFISRESLRKLNSPLWEQVSVYMDKRATKKKHLKIMLLIEEE